MLSLAERVAADAGLEWAFCDTDSLAIARPQEMDAATFRDRVMGVTAWFEPLNPYDFTGSILKIEDVNFRIDDARAPEPLCVWAVSAKRYALFNLDHDGQPTIRKASAHGLGHLLAPYTERNPAKASWLLASISRKPSCSFGSTTSGAPSSLRR